MSEKQMRKAITESIKMANAKELRAIWYFVQAFIDPYKRVEKNGQAD